MFIVFIESTMQLNPISFQLNSLIQFPDVAEGEFVLLSF